MKDQVTLFERILSGEINCDKVYEDEFTFAFHDISPVAPVHILIIPKKKMVNVASSSDSDIEILGRILSTARKVAQQLHIDTSGYRLVLNNNEDGGQTVHYLHCHLLGGRALGWPPG